jgi:hypothetical protein
MMTGTEVLELMHDCNAWAPTHRVVGESPLAHAETPAQLGFLRVWDHHFYRISTLERATVPSRDVRTRFIVDRVAPVAG